MPSFKLIYVLCFPCLLYVGGCADAHSDDSTAKVWKRVAIEKQGKRLAERGEYDLALEKYREAIGPEYVTSEWEKAPAIGSIVRILKVQARYREALEEQRWVFREKTADVALDHKAQIEALIQYQDTGDPNVVLRHIEYIKSKYSTELPPQGKSPRSNRFIVDIILLYDVVGDYDAGIGFIDDILAYFRTGKAGDPKPGRVDAEYEKVKAAFQKDKLAGTKGGATRAVIESDYFPW